MEAKRHQSQEKPRKTDGFPGLLSDSIEKSVLETKRLSAWRTEVRDERPSDRTAWVFELFSLDTPGFSGFLPLSYPVCGP